MDYRGDQRPPRSARPPGPPSYPNSADSAPQSPDVPFPPTRPPIHPSQASTFSNQTHQTKGTISFQDQERGDRHGHVGRNSLMPVAWAGDPEAGADVGRKKSLVRPDREKIEPGHRQWHYRTHAAQLEDENAGRVGVLPSATGNAPNPGRPAANLRRGKSLLGREEDVHESGLALFKRGTVRRMKRASQAVTPAPVKKSGGILKDIPGPKDAWMLYCFVLTICIPNFLLSTFGIKTPEQQRAWREKIGLLSFIAALMTVVGYITFGFTETVCGRPPNRFHSGFIDTGSVIIHGFDYDFSRFNHPKTATFFPNSSTNPLFEGNWGAAGNDISFMFQKVNQHCLGIVTKASNSSITGDNGEVDWYFPCNIYNQHGTSGQNFTNYESPTTCHITATARNDLATLHPQGQVYYTWDDVANPSRNLAVFESTVLDLNLLSWLSRSEVNYPTFFDDISKPNGTFNGKDITMQLLRTKQRQLGHCLQDLVTVGFIDTNTIGCVASEIVLYVSLVFIIGVVGIRFGMAVMFSWFFSWKLGNFKQETYEQRMQRSREIENWTNDIYRPAPSEYRPNVNKQGFAKKQGKRGFLPSTSRYTPADNIAIKSGRPTTAYGMVDSNPYKRSTMYSAKKLTPPETPLGMRDSRSSTSLADSRGFNDNPCPFPLYNVVPQPPPDYDPFGFSLAHTICLVTAYSESFEGLRTTLDSLATTDYPNSHKVILVIADGYVKGEGNDLTTPDICLTMMKDLLIPADEVEPHSYVAIADGHKRHNMAKVFAGFYDYDDATVEMSKQQRVPMVLIAKCGNPLEANDAKPGNRGKRDSQIMLMQFMMHVMFDERMTTFEYEFFNSLWRVTGVSPDRYELVLCVDADTKVFPDSMTRMVACMVQDVEIMGLCGETKIANKAETWVTMIQVFEYYNSHHNVKAFESMFGGVTCLPGCFSMYRIKAPKGESGYWVPILANPDIVVAYSENVVDSLHKKNLLLLGEDRYLTTLLLKTFPRRKNVFCPQAVCKTVVPDTFRVLLSQRRRWINSTIHNLFELVLVRDLCGTFCFSMQFVVGMELAGMLVLPAAISFTLYLIIVSIIPGGTNTTIPLVLLAIVLGLPGILIVLTSRKLAYVGWMVIYLFSLPVWNGILPMYAFWHFDDFSWGQTRQIAGDKGGNHGDKEGEFDSSHIVMKRWGEFERERRWRMGTQSRDSTLWDLRSGSPKRADSNRYSLVSSAETYPAGPSTDASTTESGAPLNAQRPRHDKDQLLMLPAPLSVTRPTTISGSSSVGRSSEEGWSGNYPASSSNQRLISSPEYGEPYDELDSPPPPAVPRHNSGNALDQFSRATGQGAVLRNMGGPNNYPGETHNPYRESRPHAAGYNDPYESDSVSPLPSSPRGRASLADHGLASSSRGVSLSDNGPVPSGDGVRRVARQSRKSSTQAPQQNRYSRTSPTQTPSPSSGYASPVQQQPYQLPPGAAAPRHTTNFGSGYIDS